MAVDKFFEIIFQDPVGLVSDFSCAEFMRSNPAVDRFLAYLHNFCHFFQCEYCQSHTRSAADFRICKHVPILRENVLHCQPLYMHSLILYIFVLHYSLLSFIVLYCLFTN